MLDCYDQTPEKFITQTKVADHPLAEAFGISSKGLIIITLQLCSALSHLASKSVVHCYVLGSNVCLRMPTRPVLCNFEKSCLYVSVDSVKMVSL